MTNASCKRTSRQKAKSSGLLKAGLGAGYFYDVHGLRVHCDTYLPELSTWDATGNPVVADVKVMLNPATSNPPVLEELTWLPYRYCSEPEYSLSVETAAHSDGTFHRLGFASKGIGVFVNAVISPSGKEVWISWSTGKDCEHKVLCAVTGALQGAFWGILLRLRGVICLHGNVLESSGKRIALLGHSGAGKSTISAALVKKGAMLLADDRVVLVQRGNRFLIQPSAAHLRLWPDSLAALQLPAEDWPGKSPTGGKRRLSISDEGIGKNGRRAEVPLDAIYVLAPRESALPDVKIETLARASALNKLLIYRSGLIELPPAILASEFRQLARLTISVPVRLLRCPDDLQRLPQTAAAILRDLARDEL